MMKLYIWICWQSGSTSVPHDSESKTNVGHCADPGCYSRIIHYSASSKQLSALIELSSECRQSIQVLEILSSALIRLKQFLKKIFYFIKYDCNYAPFEFNGIQYAWWNNRNGNPQYYWAGRNASVHTCQCGINHNCVDSSTKCNCDSAAPVLLYDNGEFTIYFLKAPVVLQ